MSDSTTSNSADLPLADLLEELVRKFQAGDAADVEGYLAQYPEHARELQGLVPTLALLAELGRVSAEGGPSEGESPDEVAGPWVGAREPGILGDFRIHREIGRGGMGIVYEAEQISLHRRVALKVLPLAAMLDSRLLQRFKNEALAAASLDHPNIVRIYSVGCDRGVHYYAMEYIEGRSLAEVIGQLRTRWGFNESEELPGTVTWVASARVGEPGPADESKREGPPARTPREGAPGTGLAAKEDTQRRPEGHISTQRGRERAELWRLAASLGIQAAEALEHAHRVGVVHRDIKPSNLLVNTAGHLWVTDFGLAVTQAESNLTMTGDIVGTLRYMSPEQLTGQRRVLDQHTDIYSLGVTLYELLTLRPAFPGTDRQRVVRQIMEDEPVPPRRIQAGIPRDLETVVLKAMAKEPQARYGSAQELAADLRRFLEDKPVTARRPSVAERLAKWARRHQPLVRVAVVFLAMMFLGSVAAAMAIWRQASHTAWALGLANERGQALQGALVEEEKARQLAEQRRKEAELGRRRASLALQESLRSSEVLVGAADALVAAGEPVQAERLYRALVSLWERLYTSPIEQSVAVEGQTLGECYRPLAELLQASGRFGEGETVYRNGVTMYQRLAADQPELAFLFLYEAAEMQSGLADLLVEAGEVPEAVAAFREALAMLEAIGSDEPIPYWNAQLRAGIHEGLGHVFWASGQAAEAKEYYRQALVLREHWAKTLPTARYPVLALASLLADCPSADLRDAPRAVELAKKAANMPPEPRDPRRYGWMVWHTLGVACYRAGQWNDSIEALSKSLAMHSFEASADRLFLAMAYHQSGNSQEARRQYEEAATWIDKNKPRAPGLRGLREEARTVLGLGRQTPKAGARFRGFSTIAGGEERPRQRAFRPGKT